MVKGLFPNYCSQVYSDFSKYTELGTDQILENRAIKVSRIFSNLCHRLAYKS